MLDFGEWDYQEFRSVHLDKYLEMTVTFMRELGEELNVSKGGVLGAPRPHATSAGCGGRLPFVCHTWHRAHTTKHMHATPRAGCPAGAGTFCIGTSRASRLQRSARALCVPPAFHR